jgi:predicted alpha/beta superfamily hydrolase
MLVQSRTVLRWVTIILGNLLCFTALAQDLPGKKDSIQSSILGEKRFFQVVLPAKFAPNTMEKYDLTYVLDGEGNTALMEDIQRFITGEGFMPQTIIVGIFNTDRNRDLTPSHEQGYLTSGGADKFLVFLKNELVPYINKTYPTNGENTLYGHSFGALFVMYALLNEPQVFKSYIAADPSFWWGNGNMEGLAKEKLPTLSGMSKTLFISGREGQGLQEMRILPMDTILQKWAPTGLSWKLVAYPDETHGTVRLKSIYDGLKFSYGGYNLKPFAIHPMGGIVLPGVPFKIWCFDEIARVRYTTDGTMPTLTSSLMQHDITLPGPTVLTAKRFTNQGRYDKSIIIEFKSGTSLAPRSKAKKAKPGGLHFAYYEGDWSRLPDFKVLKPLLTGKADTSFDINKLPRKDNFGLVLEGEINIVEEGYYVFGLSSDDGSRLYLDGQLLIDNDGLHGPELKSFIIPLKRGYYPVRLEYFQKDGGRQLTLLYITPSKILADHPSPSPIPFTSQFSD